MKKRSNWFLAVAAIVFAVSPSLTSTVAQVSQPGSSPVMRERLLMDSGWRFAFGHPTDMKKDFGTGTGYFSYFAKTGNGDGAAAANFDDRAWRMLDLPHDWAVELPFDGRGSHSHGYKAIGRNFPDTSVGWYRKSFFIPESDLGRRISVEFDGVFRDSIVWVNGHYLGREESGYTGFSYNIGEFLNYGGNNVIAVRVDATMEEGWFYEGAGIYRHVWLVKTAPLHVAREGTFVTSEVKDDAADVTAQVTVVNEGTNAATFDVEQTIINADGTAVAQGQVKQAMLKSWDSGDFSCVMTVANPKLWSIETPYLHKLVTTIRVDGTAVDRYETPFGIRSIRFDPDLGFFLNGRHVELKGTNNHQDHAGVGAAIPDALQDFRIARLKTFGCNAYRCSHNPPAPELLDACDRLGMMVLDENRQMGTSEDQLDHLKRMILRDRNHPCVIAWSLGNEEWGIEGNEKGARIASTMQAFVKHLDPTRGITAAISGGWGGGISTVIDIMGYNYIYTKDTDRQHAQFPDQPGMGTEESTARGTRGIYFSDRPNGHLAAVLELPPDPGVSGGNMETGWKHYAARPYLAGLFYWTGFDYRGEPNPLSYPAVSSQFGILDTCGFPKYSYYYLKAWWMDEPMVHVFPHWNWPGKEGQEIDVTCFSNCEEVELFLNGLSLGRKTMEKNGHLEWKVKYEPGTLLARGYKDGTEIATDQVETTGEPAVIQLTPDRPAIKADGEDVSVITVQVNDAQGRMSPIAGNEISFGIQGPGKIIGVGNGDPASHEPDVFLQKSPAHSTAVTDWKWTQISNARLTDLPEVAVNFDDSAWENDNVSSDSGPLVEGENAVFRGHVTVSEQDLAVETVKLSFGMIDDEGWVYVNGQKAGESHNWQETPSFDVKSFLHPGTNTIAVAVANGSGAGGVNKGVTLLFQEKPESPEWKRSVFNGLAQVIVQSTDQPGEITLTATSSGLSQGVLKLQTQSAPLRPAVTVR
ncbi:MAG: beta-galactosidase GalA [Verrucomicrobiia bacterium]